MPEHRPAVSVVMPFRNVEKYIAQAVQSILAQTMTDFELIMINDDCQDGSLAAINQFLPDPRIVLLHNSQRLGVAASANRGNACAKAEYIARMDSDDIAMPTRLAEQLSFMQSHPDYSVVGSFAELIDENGKLIGAKTKAITHETIRKEAFNRCPFIHPTVFYKKAAILAVGGYLPRWKYSDDFDLWLRLIFSGHKTANIAKNLLQYRVHRTSLSSAHRKGMAIEGFQIRHNAQRTFRLRLTLTERLLMVLQLICGYMIPYKSLRALSRFYLRFFRQ